VEQSVEVQVLSCAQKEAAFLPIKNTAQMSGIFVFPAFEESLSDIHLMKYFWFLRLSQFESLHVSPEPLLDGLPAAIS
tara:strand:+ start:183 stop:416 length:234 start_codon:yes stop_codon:yes gene_type:complete